MLQAHPSGNDAHSYFQTDHGDDVRTALERLQRCFVDHGINDKSVSLIFIYDEARALCDYDAYTGDRIYEERAVNFHVPKEFLIHTESCQTMYSALPPIHIPYVSASNKMPLPLNGITIMPPLRPMRENVVAKG